MLKPVLVIFMLIATQYSFALSQIECDYLGGSDGLNLDKIYINIADMSQPEVIIAGNIKKEVFTTELECGLESNPENLLYCVHERFSLIVSMDEKPAGAVMNPFVDNGQSFGPLYFSCEVK